MREDPITDRQKEFIRRLCEEQDGETDEEWLAKLTRGEAHAFIKERIGK